MTSFSFGEADIERHSSGCRPKRVGTWLTSAVQQHWPGPVASRPKAAQLHLKCLALLKPSGNSNLCKIVKLAESQLLCSILSYRYATQIETDGARQ